MFLTKTIEGDGFFCLIIPFPQFVVFPGTQGLWCIELIEVFP